MVKVMFVEDDTDFREPVAHYLRKVGMEVMEADSAEQMETLVEAFSPDIFLLDVNLPVKDGFSIANHYRDEHATRIIMLSARNAAKDHIEGLSVGADYYLNKPVQLRELEAVILSTYRRIDSHSEESTTTSEKSWFLEPKAWLIHSPDGQQFNLTHAEHKLLTLLLSSIGEVISRESLSAALGKKFFDPMDRTIDLVISRLRKKCNCSAYPLLINSARGEGYTLMKNIEKGAG